MERDFLVFIAMCSRNEKRYASKNARKKSRGADGNIKKEIKEKGTAYMKKTRQRKRQTTEIAISKLNDKTKVTRQRQC